MTLLEIILKLNPKICELKQIMICMCYITLKGGIFANILSEIFLYSQEKIRKGIDKFIVRTAGLGVVTRLAYHNIS